MGLMLAVMITLLVPARNVEAAGTNQTVPNGVSIGSIDVSGMTADQANAAVEKYMDDLKNVTVTLHGRTADQTVTMTAGQMGLSWTNPDVVEEALTLGTKGNVVQRYKDLKDAQNTGKKLELDYALDDTVLTQVLEDQCKAFNVAAVNYGLTRENGAFTVTGGSEGYQVNEAASLKTIQDYVEKDWNLSNCDINLVIDEQKPEGSAEDLSKVKDVLGTYTTSYTTSGSARSANVANGCRLASGKTLYPGEEYSVLDNITPFTEANGYYPAGSYLQGLVVESIGGGICQVSTTLYNAVLRAELKVTERYNHSMIINYVDPSADAAIAENGGKNFKFVNNTDYPVYIEGYTENKHITFTIYGVETRPSDRKVSFESKTLSTTEPGPDSFVTDATQPVGYVHIQTAHQGIKAQLEKVVTVGGVEQSRETINNSNYQMVPRIVTVGTASADANTLAQINAAIATGSADTVKAVTGALAAQIAAGVPTADAAAQASMDAVAQAQAAAQAATQAQAAAPDNSAVTGQ